MEQNCCISVERLHVMERRSFLAYFGVGWAASCFPLVLSACDSTGSSGTTASSAASSTSSSTAPSTIASSAAANTFSVAELDGAGSVGNDKVVVVRDPADKTKLIAVNPTCTHKGCTVKWEAKDKGFACGCHGAKFAASGKVTNGPAEKPLATYSAKIAGDRVVVTM
jgi:cytochrome b6-f complex iron-sulfur subunit